MSQRKDLKRGVIGLKRQLEEQESVYDIAQEAGVAEYR